MKYWLINSSLGVVGSEIMVPFIKSPYNFLQNFNYDDRELSRATAEAHENKFRRQRVADLVPS